MQHETMVKDTDTVITERAEWNRPQLRRLEASEAQTTNGGTNADGGFS